MEVPAEGSEARIGLLGGVVRGEDLVDDRVAPLRVLPAAGVRRLGIPGVRPGETGSRGRAQDARSGSLAANSLVSRLLLVLGKELE
jgi:hypothetical protein